MNWTVIGINYKKANVSQRQRYALNSDQIIKAYENFRCANINEALVISTCNRTEFFFPSELKTKIKEILFEKIYKESSDTSLFHCKRGLDATHYFFRICSGLESQILGDFEILGQVRKSCALAKKEKMLSGTWERLINNALGAAKKARSSTGFYSGASSTSYACIEYLRKVNVDFKASKYLILGAGKIGGHTIDHLMKIVEPNQITLSNRTPEKAIAQSNKKGLKMLPFEEVVHHIEAFDVIICATNAPQYIIHEQLVRSKKKRYIIDLSVPLNVDPKVGLMTGVDLVNVDELSKIINENLLKRAAQKKEVERIISESIQDFEAWYTIKTGMPILSELKEELNELKKEALSNLDVASNKHSEAFLDQYTDELFNQLSQQWIKKVRNKTA